MREIKFRAWDKSQKKFIPDWQDCVWLECYGFTGGDEFIVEQFTGLTDKKGVDIYEHDFIKNEHGRVSVVVWHEFSAGWDCTFVSDKYLVDNVVAYEGFETKKWKSNVIVIGNKYEDNELLIDKGDKQ